METFYDLMFEMSNEDRLTRTELQRPKDSKTRDLTTTG